MFTNPQFLFSTEPAWQANFLGASSLPAGLSASGGTNGTYFNSSGVLTAGSAPRFDYSYNGSVWVPAGLLIEGAATNITRYSQTINTTNWNPDKSAMTVNAAVAPDGTTSATKINPTSSSNPIIYISQSGSSGIWTQSFYAKAAGMSWVYIRPANNDSGKVIWFNVTTGVVGTSLGGYTGIITNVGNGWYRCSVTSTASITPSFAVIGPTDADNSTFATVSSNGIYVWGAQAENNSFPTSYVPTTSAAVTRTADVVQFTGASLTALQGAQGGVVIQLLDENATNPTAIKSIINGTNNILYHDTTGKAGTTNGTNILLTASAATWTAATRIGLAWASGARALAATGLSNATDANSASNSGTLYLGSSNGSAAENAWFQGISIYRQNIAKLLQSKMTVNGPY